MDTTAAEQLLDHPSSPATNHTGGCEKVQIDFNSVTYIVNKGSKTEKTVLADTSCSLHSGALTALMGPSGAGKTTFLSILLQNAAHHLEGTVMANGLPITSGFSKMTNYVPQEDVMMTALTPQEALSFMARLRIGGSATRRNAKINELLNALGLEHCRNTRVGTVEDRGLSGGERKRLSIAMELLDDPAVLVLDEPTTGLDSKAAEDVIRILEKLAQGGRLVLATIHQPSWAVLELFQHLLILKSGRMVYDGQVEEVVPYFEELGQMMPKNVNPIDYIMRVIQEDLPEEGKIDTWSSVWAQHAPPHQPAIPDTTPPWSQRKFAVSSLEQFRVLFARNSVDFFKDKKQCAQSVAAKAVIGLLVGFCWVNASRPPKAGANGEKVFTTTGALFMIVNNCLMDDLMATVIGFPSIKAILHREIKNGVYGVAPWFAAFWLSKLTTQMVLALVLALPVYFLVGLRLDNSGEHLFIAVGCLVLCSVSGTTMGLAAGSCSKDIVGALGLVLPVMAPMLLFSGWVIPYSEVPVAFKWIYWISPFQYAFNIMRINQFRGINFEDDGCINGQHNVKSPFSSLFCNGNEYLDTLSFDLDPIDYMKRAFLLLGAVGVTVIIFTFTILSWKVQKKTG